MGKNKHLDAIIQKIEMDASNNYKDAAQAGLRELEAAGKVSGRQKEYYEERLSAFQERMKNFTHKDQKATW